MLEIKNPDQRINSSNNNNVREKHYDTVARILVLGIGGAGNNAINRMIEDNVRGVEFVAVNTDKQDLNHCKAPTKVAIGEKLTGGRGCGAMPEVGEGAANESKELIRALFRETNGQKKADMVFITCGMGGGTGTGAAPIIANIAREEGILTVAVVTKPFRFEGRTRMNRALTGINKLYPNVDTMIVIPNDKLFQIVDPKDGFKESFAKADEILKQSIRGITDLINLPALVNLDFADISTVMRGKGIAHIAVGEGAGDERMINAIKKAIDSPLLETSIDGATDLIVCISGKVSLMDVDAAMREIEPKLSPDVNIILGAREDENSNDTVSITLIATGIRDVKDQYFNNKPNYYSNPQQVVNQQVMPNMQNIGMTNDMNYMNYQDAMNRQQNPNQNNSNIPNGLGAFFSNKKNKNLDTTSHDTNLHSGLKNRDSLNIDLNKLGFGKKDSNTDLPSFIDNQ